MLRPLLPADIPTILLLISSHHRPLGASSGCAWSFVTFLLIMTLCPVGAAVSPPLSVPRPAPPLSSTVHLLHLTLCLQPASPCSALPAKFLRSTQPLGVIVPSPLLQLSALPCSTHFHAACAGHAALASYCRSYTTQCICLVVKTW